MLNILEFIIWNEPDIKVPRMRVLSKNIRNPTKRSIISPPIWTTIRVTWSVVKNSLKLKYIIYY